ncbi:MAG TPA: hypothetical protein V6C81_17990 [Planktothrix sp.]|jgi:hypothetical protein
MLKHFALAALYCAVSVALEQPVFADYRVPVNLQKADPYMAPLKVQILDETPQVSDFRQRTHPVNYVISVPPMQQASPQTVFIAPAAASGGSNLRPQQIVLDPTHPPAAGFISNIPAHGLAEPGGLPSGNSTNLLGGKMNPPAVPQRQVAAPHMVWSKPATGHTPVTEQYAPQAPSASASFSGNTQLNVKAKMQPNRVGSMLNR